LHDLAAALLPGDADAAAVRIWHIPVCYDAAVAPDLPAVAAAAGLSVEEAAALHASRGYTVYLMGFSPGFPYLGDLDPRLVLPRRPDPRPRVPAGSVAIATTHTAIYPQDTPGGWHLVGRTPARLFDATGTPPALLAPGDEVRFVPVSLAEYERLAPGKYLPQCETIG
jgi:KipI family sensor histidine kinase inhibitor